MSTYILRPSKRQMELDLLREKNIEVEPFRNYLKTAKSQFLSTCNKVDEFKRNLVDSKKIGSLENLEKMKVMINLSAEFLQIYNDLDFERELLQNPLTPDCALKVEEIKKKCLAKSAECHKEIEECKKLYS